jgi:hypothetical protein
VVLPALRGYTGAAGNETGSDVLKRLAGLAVTLVVLGSGAWLAWAMLSERAVTDWLDARATEGWYVNYADLSVTGYPTAFRTEFEALELADPDTGWLWTLPSFRLESDALRPDRIRADLARGAGPCLSGGAPDHHSHRR